MLPNVEARCPECAETTKLPAHHFRIWRCTSHAGRDFYTFLCGSCDEPVARPADATIVALLMAAGVPSHLFSLPAEIHDRKRLSDPWTPYDEFDLLHEIRGLPETGVRV